MQALTGGTRQAFLAFFGSHIVFTLLVDGQALFSSHYPAILRSLLMDVHVATSGDILMKGDPAYEVWFQSVVLAEWIFQLPFFVAAVSFLLQQTSSYYPSWFQGISLLYVGHVLTTMVPIYATFVTTDQMDLTQKLITSSVYAPYVIFPAWYGYLAFPASPSVKSKDA